MFNSSKAKGVYKWGSDLVYLRGVDKQGNMSRFRNKAFDFVWKTWDTDDFNILDEEITEYIHPIELLEYRE